jgi:hypothetical protein
MLDNAAYMPSIADFTCAVAASSRSKGMDFHLMAPSNNAVFASLVAALLTFPEIEGLACLFLGFWKPFRASFPLFYASSMASMCWACMKAA